MICKTCKVICCISIIFFVLAVVGCGSFETNKTGKMVIMPSGLKYIDIVVGTGPFPDIGSTVTTHYTGWLEDGTKFDSSRDRGESFSFFLGLGQVIKGWDEGIATMRVGGKRRLIIPPELGYGKGGFGDVIPPNATLIFEIELLEIK